MTTRGTFLAAGAGVPLALAAEPGSANAATAGSPYDFAAVAARLARPARHRQVYATARVADGAVTGFMSHALQAYETTRGEGRGALHAAAVFYSLGVVLGFDDVAWRTYRLAEAVRRRGDVLAPREATGNPFMTELSALAARDCTFLVCDNAVANWANYLITSGVVADKPIEEVRADLRQRLVPNGFLVPAGVAALNDTQEARFTYVQASL